MGISLTTAHKYEAGGYRRNRELDGARARVRAGRERQRIAPEVVCYYRAAWNCCVCEENLCAGCGGVARTVLPVWTTVNGSRRENAVAEKRIPFHETAGVAPG